jgi:hypothetical protein
MVATTRTKTGSIPARIEAALAPSRANTSKPRDKKVASGRVAKPKGAGLTKKTADGKTVKAKTVRKEKAPATKAKDKVAGAVEKVVGKAEGRPGKKVCLISNPCWSVGVWGFVLTRCDLGGWNQSTYEREEPVKRSKKQSELEGRGLCE